MAADNHTTIVGNLAEDPELRFTQSGIAVTNLRVAVTQRVQQDGQWRDGDTSFFKVNVWRGQAEHLADSLAKGDRVMVTGRLRQRSWDTPEGDKRSVTELEAEEVGASLKWATEGRADQPARQRRPDPRAGAAGRTRRRLRRPAAVLARLVGSPRAPVAPPGPTYCCRWNSRRGKRLAELGAADPRSRPGPGSRWPRQRAYRVWRGPGD
jgi:single-strand DNA-binding protein